MQKSDLTLAYITNVRPFYLCFALVNTAVLFLSIPQISSLLITVRKTPQGRPIAKPLQPQSYFETYNDVYAALIEYSKNPYGLESNKRDLTWLTKELQKIQ